MDSIKISNFRCFNETEISGFKQFNLFGGKNNSGKTTLLEAIYFASSHLNSQGRSLNEFLRGTGDNNLLANLKNIYNNSNKIRVECIDIIGFKEFENGEKIKQNEDEEGTVFREFENGKFTQSKLAFQITFNKSNGQTIPNELNIVQDFDKLSILGKDFELLKIAKIVDSSINHIRTYASNPNFLYLKKEGGDQYHPLAYHGDAMNKLIKYVLLIFNCQEGAILLLDEIENGLHYTIHEEFIYSIIKLCNERQVQFFATTHSKEFIQAFINVINDHPELKEKSAYFEMAKHYKTNEIIASSIPLDALEIKLSQNKSFRGE